MSTRILIADDEERWRRIVCDFLRNEDYEVIEAADGIEALEYLRKLDSIDLVILDIMMPNLNGIETCRKIRTFSNVPVMIVTAKDGDESEIEGFSCGADDYVSKPVKLKVFIARVKALLKRTGSEDGVFCVGRIEINQNSHVVTVEGKRLNLTPREYELLIYLSKNKNIALSRQQILHAVWDFDFFGDARTVDTHVKNLRMKLGDAGDQIVTVRGSGYMMEA